ncbi:MAG TPA: glycosyltransferase [Candidatus Paceibacterota bacterium]
MGKPFLSVIIPAFNEARRLPMTLIDIDRYLADQEFSYEILVVDDGSTDNTSEIVNRFSAMIKNLKLLPNSGNIGVGSAVKIGMLAGKGNWRLALDAGNSISVREFGKVMPILSNENNFGIVIASRAEKRTVFNPPPKSWRRISEAVVNYFTRKLLGSKVRDFLLGFQCFSSEAAEKIFSLIKLKSWSYSQEALVLGEKIGFNIKEIQVAGSRDDDGHFPPFGYLQMLLDAARIWWWLKRGKYELT